MARVSFSYVAQLARITKKENKKTNFNYRKKGSKKGSARKKQEREHENNGSTRKKGTKRDHVSRIVQQIKRRKWRDHPRT